MFLIYISAIALSLVCFLLIVAIIVAVIMVRSRRKQKREEEKKKQEEMELEQKQPLNNDVTDNYIDTYPNQDNYQNQNYLARLDEFSMISATLGGKSIKKIEDLT